METTPDEGSDCGTPATVPAHAVDLRSHEQGQNSGRMLLKGLSALPVGTAGMRLLRPSCVSPCVLQLLSLPPVPLDIPHRLDQHPHAPLSPLASLSSLPSSHANSDSLSNPTEVAAATTQSASELQSMAATKGSDTYRWVTTAGNVNAPSEIGTSALFGPLGSFPETPAIGQRRGIDAISQQQQKSQPVPWRRDLQEGNGRSESPALSLFSGEMPPQSPQFEDVSAQDIFECRETMRRYRTTRPNTRLYSWKERGEESPVPLLEDEMPPQSPFFADISAQDIIDCRETMRRYRTERPSASRYSWEKEDRQEQLLEDEMPPHSPFFADISAQDIAEYRETIHKARASFSSATTWQRSTWCAPRTEPLFRKLICVHGGL
ncbi:hypothetical protein H4R24_003431 [Coemansia sp. RSA 988]|nr:hypothetical protein H4R24_003431 [Coemansia sp. RSA 988]